MWLRRSTAAPKNAKCRASAFGCDDTVIPVDHLPFRRTGPKLSESGFYGYLGNGRGTGQPFDLVRGFDHAHFPPDRIGIDNIHVR